MDENIFLVFGTQAGTNRQVRINNPRNDLTNAAVRSVMNGIINSQVVTSSGGRVTSIRRAFFQRRTVQHYDLD